MKASSPSICGPATSAGLFDVSHMGQLIVAGAGAEKGLESLLPADLALLKDGRLRYSLLLNAEGGIIDDLMVTRRGDHFYVVVNGATKEGDIAHLEARLPRPIVRRSYEGAGPARAAGAEGGRRAVAAGARGRGARLHDRGARSRSAAPAPGSAARAIPARTASKSRSSAATPTKVADLLADQPEVKPIGLGARDSLRLEAGLPLYGHDLGHDTTPVEADLTFALSKRRRAEGGFPGWHRIARELADGPIRKRVGLAHRGPPAGPRGRARGRWRGQ